MSSVFAWAWFALVIVHIMGLSFMNHMFALVGGRWGFHDVL